MPRPRRRSLTLALAALGPLAVLACPAPAGASSVLLDLNDTVQASTTLATLGETITLSSGTFHGTVSTSGAVKGKLAMPETTTTLRLAGIGLANVTIGFQPTKPVTGRLDLGSMSLRATATQYLLVRRVEPLGLPVNLVGRSCRSATPVAIRFTGSIAATGVITVSGTYTIPSFSHCAGEAAALDLAVSGSGNTFDATLTPPSS